MIFEIISGGEKTDWVGKEWAGLFFPRGKNGPAHSFPGEKTDWGEIPACYTGSGLFDAMVAALYKNIYCIYSSFAFVIPKDRSHDRWHTICMRLKNCWLRCKASIVNTNKYLRVGNGQQAMMVLTASVCIFTMAVCNSFGARWQGNTRIPSSSSGVKELKAKHARSSRGLTRLSLLLGLSAGKLSLSFP